MIGRDEGIGKKDGQPDRERTAGTHGGPRATVTMRASSSACRVGRKPCSRRGQRRKGVVAGRALTPLTRRGACKPGGSARVCTKPRTAVAQPLRRKQESLHWHMGDGAVQIGWHFASPERAGKGRALSRRRTGWHGPALVAGPTRSAALARRGWRPRGRSRGCRPPVCPKQMQRHPWLSIPGGGIQLAPPPPAKVGPWHCLVPTQFGPMTK